ncbi:putative regulator of volume decrease after cellular swelling [Lyophyllum shimeji]|uniref:Regulator of volume decrease after cellular swelling n=1 Tax=Lyophyllum shimeji TaxID=47721 RepID=A0A9P3PSB7_LYOSH|nr:putative regulator of volume decrease after cellular swelling [Lyophyllum shimeji]
MPAVTLITTLPHFATPEEHRTFVGSTPASFADIPPVLKHQEDNVAVRLEPPVDGFRPQDAAQGTLYVLTSVLVFMSTTGRGFQIEYPAITLHAISRAATDNGGPSIYCQLDESTPNVEGAPAPAAVVDDEEDTPLRELSILPQAPEALEPIFDALSQCAALHPDREALEDAQEGEFTNGDETWIDTAGPDSAYSTFTGDEAQELSEVGRAALEHLESIMYDPRDLPTPPSPSDPAAQMNGATTITSTTDSITQHEVLHEAVQASALDVAAEESANPLRALGEGVRPLRNTYDRDRDRAP